MLHDSSRWRFWRQTSPDGYAQQWILESDEYHGMAILTLQHVSQWHKDRHPEWEQEWNADVARVQANADLIQSAPRMLEALLAAQQGDMSQVQEAIDMATGKLDWLGKPKADTLSNS